MEAGTKTHVHRLYVHCMANKYRLTVVNHKGTNYEHLVITLVYLPLKRREGRVTVKTTNKNEIIKDCIKLSRASVLNLKLKFLQYSPFLKRQETLKGMKYRKYDIILYSKADHQPKAIVLVTK